MQFAGGAALTNVNNARLRIDPIERLAKFSTVALGAVQKHMHMRVPARYIRAPDVDLVKVPDQSSGATMYADRSAWPFVSRQRGTHGGHERGVPVSLTRSKDAA